MWMRAAAMARRHPLSLRSSSHRTLASPPRPPARYTAAVFDLGGVILQPSPVVLLRKATLELMQKDHVTLSLAPTALGAFLASSGVFHALERGQATLSATTLVQMAEEGALSPHLTGVPKEDVQAALEKVFVGMEEDLDVDAAMAEAVRVLRAHGVRVATLTNNWYTTESRKNHPETALPAVVHEMFDVVAESAVTGRRKPEHEAYTEVLNRLGATPQETLFLDDLGTNCKAAKAAGMGVIRVKRVSEALANLAAAFPQVPIVVPPAAARPIRWTKTTSTSAAAKPPRLDVPAAVAYAESVGALPTEEATLLEGPTSAASSKLYPFVDAREFSHGQSNPTFYLARGGRAIILRKKPPGKLVPGAHAVEREYRVTAALAQHGVPVAPPISLCKDEAVLGTPFYLAEYVAGDVYMDPNLPGLAPARRADIYSGLAQTLAAIHRVDPAEAGLGDYSKQSANYTARQLKQWAGQYERNRDAFPVEAMDALLAWLPAHLPPQTRTSVVHGDYRLDNVVFSPDGRGQLPLGGVRAVLDWELSTLGDPMCDLAQLCLPYYFDGDVPPLLGIRPAQAEGVPVLSDFVDEYCTAAGVPNILATPEGQQQWRAYMAYTCFRVAAILHGVYVRSTKGQSASADGSVVGRLAAPVANIGVRFVEEYAAAASLTQSDADGPRQSVSSVSDGDALPPLAPGTTPEARAAHVAVLRSRLEALMRDDVLPVEATWAEHARGPDRWTIHPSVEHLKQKAKALGLWNLFMPLESDPLVQYGGGLTNEEYTGLCEIMGQSLFASEVFNCSAPDTGNMEVLARYGTPAQRERWLTPLLQGEIRSCFAMTEPAVASSDATNIQASIVRDGDDYVVNGHKWWISGALDPRCDVAIVMGKTDPTQATHRQQSMILVPMSTPGVEVVRPMTVYGYDDAPHGHAEMRFTDVRVPCENLLVGEGEGFAIAQGRLGPGRIHHCMRLIGMAERALDLMCQRVLERSAFGSALADKGTIRADIAASRADIEQCRLLTIAAARKMDLEGNKAARREIALIKMAQRVVDRAIQAHGAMGLSQDTVLAHMFAWARVLRMADGPDEVHATTVARLELARAKSASLAAKL